MSDRALNIGLIGCGRWGQNILRDLVELGCVVTVVDPSDEARQAAVSNGAKLALPGVPELSDVQGIVVASPTITHTAVLDLLRERDTPIYVEKPLTNDVQAAQALAARAPSNIFVMDKWRYHPGIECLREIVEQRQLGAVRGLRTTRTQDIHVHEDVDPIWILAPHDLSIGLEILGFVPAVQSAQVCSIGDVPCGLIATLGENPWQVLEVSGCHSDRQRSVYVYCEEGIAALKDPYADCVELTRFTLSGTRIRAHDEKISIDTEFPLRRELKAFLSHIQGGPPPKSSIIDAVSIVATIARLRVCAGLTG